MRYSLAIIAVVAFASVMMPTDARAQYNCVTDAVGVTCTNTGTGGPSSLTTGGTSLNATTINSGTSGDISTTADSGNALTNNSGSVFDFVSTSTALGGNATSINSGLVNRDIATFTDGGGNAATLNVGTVGGMISTTTNAGGDALTVNSGSVLNNLPLGPAIVTQTDSGHASTTNSGFVSGDVLTLTGAFGGNGNATTFNSGTINGDVLTAVGFGGGGSGNASFVNTGTVNAISSGVEVVVAGDGNASFANYGTVRGDVIVLNPVGIGNTSFANYGTIYGLFGGVAISSVDGNATGYNQGRIFGEVNVVGGNTGSAVFTNAGLIDGTNFSGVAINMLQVDPDVKSTLNILPGSRIVGNIFLSGFAPYDPLVGYPATTVNILSGHDVSSVLTFGGNTCGCGFGGLTDTGAIVNVTGGAPYVINGNTVAILDPTSFAMADRNVIDVTRTITSLVTSRLTNPAPISGNGSSAMGFAPSGNVARDMANDAFSGIPALAYAGNDRVLLSNPSFTAADGTSIWAQGFGGQRIQQADAPTLRSVNNFYGGVLGVDKTVQPGLRLGGFIGAGNVKSTIELNSGDTNSDMVFGGVYGRYAMGRAFLDFSLLGGGSSNDVKRTIANNLVPGGYEYAAGKYNGWFISPEIAYGLTHSLGANLTLTPTARVRYLAAGFGGYEESRSSTNLSVGSRTSHNFEERGEFRLTHTTNATPTEQLQLSGTAGLIALQRAGDSTVNTILLGQSLAFATPGKASIVGFYTGAGFDWRNASGISVFGATEFTAMSDSSQTITGRGGVKVAF